MTELRRAAAAVLDQNWTGAYTTPSTGLYPHQWSWDSAFIAIGLRHLDPARARRELISLLDAQWSDGRLPQIVYDVSRDEDYQPNAAFWRTQTPPAAPEAATAGLIQPPNHAWAAWLVHQADPDGSAQESFLANVYPRLVAWHAYLASARTTPGSELASIVHPWEAGTDNSPLWDEALAPLPRVNHEIPRPDLRHASATERPSQKEYGTYYWLAEQYRGLNCDHRSGHWQFLMEDPSLNALWAASEHMLTRMARELGADPARHEERAGALTEALHRLYQPDLGLYVARNAISGSLVPKATVNGLVPLILPTLPRVSELLDTLSGPRFLGHEAILVPSYDATAPDHDPAQYWRGPSWFNMTWLIIQGLLHHGEHRLAQQLSSTLQRVALADDFPEYVDPFTGSPHGARRFSWTAALAVDLEQLNGTGAAL